MVRSTGARSSIVDSKTSRRDDRREVTAAPPSHGSLALRRTHCYDFFIPNPPRSHAAGRVSGEAMRDPMSWSIPLFRAFGIQVKLHVLYIVITLAMLLRVWSMPNGKESLLEHTLIWVVMLFLIILLHEFGHCFAARRMDGEAEEILMWPLGGLAFCAVPHTARANFVTAIGGPLVNVLICLGAGAAIVSSGRLPPVNVFQVRQLYYPELHNWRTGSDDRRDDRQSPYFQDRTSGKKFSTFDFGNKPDGTIVARHPDTGKFVEVDSTADGQAYPEWVLWSARLFWMSWLLLLFNCIPAFPMDFGRVLQCLIWGRTGDYRAATQIACWTGMTFALGFFVVALWWSDAMLLALGIFVMVTSYHQLVQLDNGGEERGAFGYDFSKGYGGFGPDEDATPVTRPKRVGPIKRWLQARRTKKIQKEVEQRAADDSRLDELLDKIARLGKESLSAEEKRFMAQVSARYRNRP